MPMLRASGGTTPSGAESRRSRTRIEPVSGTRYPAIRRSVVVLPQPDGPNSVTNSLSGMSSLKSLSAPCAASPPV